VIDREQNGTEEYSKWIPPPKRIKTGKGLERASPDAVLVLCLTQGNQPNCSLALADIACQSYCINHATVVRVHDEHVRQATGGGDEAAWDADQGFDVYHLVSALFKILGGYNEPLELFPGASMLIRAPVAQGPALVGAEADPALVGAEADPALVGADLRAFVNSGWTDESNLPSREFDLWVVSIPVRNGEDNLVHMYAIKAFYKVGETTKTWVVLDVVPGFLPYVVEDLVNFLNDRIRRVAHLRGSFDEINAEEAFVFGVKGEYANRSFNHAESHIIGLPYNVTPVPDGVPFSYRIFNLASLNFFQPPTPATPVDLHY
jgi:hypothetical protein